MVKLVRKYTGICARNLTFLTSFKAWKIKKAKHYGFLQIQTDSIIKNQRPDIFVTNKQKKECKIIDIFVPGDQKN